MDLLARLIQADSFEDEVIEGVEASGLDLAGKEFARCTFRRAKLAESCWRRAHLEDCVFEEADLTRMQVTAMVLRDVVFRGSKLMAVDWTGLARDPRITFEDCDLRYASFSGMRLQRTAFLRCRATEASFTECDLTEACFDGTDLKGSVFERSTLCKARLAQASGVFIDPTKNRIKGAEVSVECAILLAMSFGLRVDGYDDEE